MNESKIKDCMKFRELKVYGSTQWFAHKQKDYRRVFEASETSYLYAEFSFLIKNLTKKIGTSILKFSE